MKKDKIKNNEHLDTNEIDEKMQKYYKACESEKRGKSTALSLIFSAVLLFLVLLVVILKLNGVGKTIVFDTSVTNENQQISPYVADVEDVEAQNVFELIGDKINGEDTTTNSEITQAE